MQKSQELKEIVLQMYRAMDDRDVPGIMELISRQAGTLIIGTDPDEWMWGYDEIQRVYNAQVPEMGGVKVIPGEIEAFQNGPVGWVADKPALKFPDGNEVRMRCTFVFQQEESGWKLVQEHLSVGALNEETVGRELTI